MGASCLTCQAKESKMKAIMMCVMILFFITLSAINVSNKPYEFTQPDGTKLSLFVSGDEFYHRVHDKEGYTILKDPQTGYAVFAIPEGESIKASEYVVGETNPASLGLTPGLVLRDPQRQQLKQEQLELRRSQERVPTMGSFNNLVCFVRFDDEWEFPDSLSYSYYADHFNSYSRESLREYYEEVSLNRLHISSHLYPPADPTGHVVSYRSNHNRGHYQPYSFPDNQLGYTDILTGLLRLKALVSDVADYLDSVVPSSVNVDSDSDGIVDALVLIIRGEPDSWGDVLWPKYDSYLTSAGEINSADVKHCIFTLEVGFGASVVCHEMGHNLGFPDMYHYSDDAPWDSIKPCGRWDLMASDRAQHTLCYNKWKYGQWFSTINVLTPTMTPTVYDLAPVTPSNPYPCYKILSSNPNQFYMLEYRRKEGRYEDGIPATGLIVYRVNTDAGDGNSNGPPDEVYVYRPGGVVNTNGTLDDANFSEESGRTSIHNYTDPKPWLWVNESTTPDGNLVITNVRNSLSGNSIQFTLQLGIPYVWNGSVSTAWNDPNNWNQGSYPGVTDYVEIPSDCPRYPFISSTTSGICHHLTLKHGAQLTIYNGNLTVNNDFEIYGNITMNHSSGSLTVLRDMLFNHGASMNVTALAVLSVQRWLEFHPGSNVDLNNGIIELSGSAIGYIRTFKPTSIYHLRSNKNPGFASGIGEISDSTLTIKGNLYILDGSTFNHYYAGTTVLLGGFYAFTGSILHFNMGTLSMEGAESKVISIADASNYLNHLTINKSSGATVSLSYDVDVRGHLLIQSGYLDTNSRDFYLGGNWTNNIGPAAFIEGTRSVFVKGGANQIMGSETFYKLVLNKAYGEMQIPTGSAVSCAQYDWMAGTYRVNGGIFSVADLVDPGIFGKIYLNSGLIEYQQDSSNYNDLRGELFISGGTFRVMGGLGPNYFSYVDVATLTMTGGVLDYVHQGIDIPAGYLFNDYISGGIIRTSKDFRVYRTDFNPTGGVIELYGSTDATLHMIETPGSNFSGVTIYKSASRDETNALEYPIDPVRMGNSNPPARTNVVTGSGLLDINGNFRIEAGTFVAPNYMKMAGNWTNLAGPEFFTQGTGTQTVEFNGSGYQYCNYTEVFNILMLNKSASSLRINLPGADISCNSYTWANGKIQVFDGSFTAHDLSQDGIYGDFEVDTGGTINLYQDASQFIDVNGFFILNGGTINVYGGSVNSYVGYNGLGGFQMNGGTIDFKNRGITIQTVTNYFTFAVNGGLIRIAGSWIDMRGSVCLDSGVLEMYGASNNTIRAETGSYFNHLTISKPAANIVSAISDLQVNGTLVVDNGIFNTNGKIISVGFDVEVTGKLALNAGSQLKLSDGKDLIILDGGWLETIGSVASPAFITRKLDGYYGFNVESGATISAGYTYFEYMNIPGVNVKSGALISTDNPFNYCIFRNGIADGTLLTINNTQTLVVPNINFQTNTWGGAYNVTKLNNQGSVHFSSYIGGFSGPNFENDPNSRIFWGDVLQRVPTPSITYNANQNVILLDWVYPVSYDYFKIMGSDSPGGPFNQVGTTTNTHWYGPASSNKSFYQVKAIRN